MHIYKVIPLPSIFQIINYRQILVLYLGDNDTSQPPTGYDQWTSCHVTYYHTTFIANSPSFNWNNV